jgi:orotidine-5'-phosphate decarboxylase
MDAYAQAWLTPGSPLEADAMTANPFLGVGALDGTFDLAERHGKGVFVLAATSNPDAFTAQRAVLPSGETVSAAIMREVSQRNAGTTPDGQWASLGFVVGGTVDWTDAGLRAFSPVAPILAPGFGHQGAEPHDLRARFGDLAEAVIASESRSILAAGPDRLAARISERALLYRGD